MKRSTSTFSFWWRWPFISHSQMTAIRHPASRSFCCANLSRLIVPDIFDNQNSVLVRGVFDSLQRCPCQKHPFTNRTVLNFGKTISGVPGMDLTWRRKRKPRACNALRIRISGLVSLFLIARIFFERISTLWTSGIVSRLKGANLQSLSGSPHK